VKKDYLKFLDCNNIFIDFDGVIKDSVEVKSDAFEQLFLSYGKEIAKKIRLHHEGNGGLSRFDKLRLYLSWSGQIPSKQLINDYADTFSSLVKQKVIDSEWVLGVQKYLAESRSSNRNFFLVTATPQKEIEEIVLALNIRKYFKEVIGSPTKKHEAIRVLLDKFNIDSSQAIMIGDYMSDNNAAKINNVEFILRRTSLNMDLQQNLNCQMIDNFL
jgi:phosphoglycolate phosphatase-like HAD superfamily hydrolase